MSEIKKYAIIDKSNDHVVNIIMSDLDNIHLAITDDTYFVECTPLVTLGLKYDKEKGHFPEVFEEEQHLELDEKIRELQKEIDFVHNPKAPPSTLTEDELKPFYDYYFEISSYLGSNTDLNLKKEKINSLIKPDYSIIENAYLNETENIIEEDQTIDPSNT